MGVTAAFPAGFFLGLSLIAAIGAQNAFVLRQGLLRQYVAVVCFVCALSDAVLIVAGVAGFGALVTAAPWIATVMTLAGCAFLTVYGVRSSIAAFTGSQGLDPARVGKASLKRTLLACLAFTWLNPHVYLDTVVFLGSVSTGYGDRRFVFAAGAMAASFMFFFALGYGARFLAPLFARPVAWRVLDFLIGCIVLALALKLALDLW
ncbi:MAG: Lysine exporter protein (LYSE/YGGA) [Candidatus Tokpelaia hoelldobleri]|uniref:Lysine exporter protein (LYSE/YGGA) n=1 Tax=Candidatus Tokpelaia hoelldobleri TaxID=1902579 RepID=A0A1U9JWH0_9HYPH|nr:MAG: Lysine exporter protein (LYSE/YGGA) [Candidatus Tokpelaia hoelldoblerii]